MTPSVRRFLFRYEESRDTLRRTCGPMRGYVFRAYDGALRWFPARTIDRAVADGFLDLQGRITDLGRSALKENR